MSIKIKGPKGTTSINVDGKQYEADKKGVFTLPDGIDPGALSPHGFVIDDSEPTEADAAAAKAAAEAEAAAKAAADAAAAANKTA